MLASKQGGFCTVFVMEDDTEKFKDQWPCHNLPECFAVLFEFDCRNGDLVNITMWESDEGIKGNGGYIDSAEHDGAALVALAQDAEVFAIKAGHLPQWIMEAKHYN